MVVRHVGLVTVFFFFFNDPATPEIYTLPLHDALPISYNAPGLATGHPACHTLHFLLLQRRGVGLRRERSEEHTSELQSRPHLVCRLLLEKKKLYRVGSVRRMRMNPSLDSCTVADADSC